MHAGLRDGLPAADAAVVRAGMRQGVTDDERPLIQTADNYDVEDVQHVFLMTSAISSLS